MPNREKVIKGLECCASMNGSACRECPYSSECIDYEVPYPTGTAHLAADALVLLKEQEAVKPKKADNPDESEYCCGICGYPLWLDEFYCAHCGRRIEWESR